MDLQTFIKDAPPVVILCWVARVSEMTRYDVVGPRRDQRFMLPRIACYWALRQKGLSFPAIGTIMKRDHSTVLSGLRRVREGHRELLEKAKEAYENTKADRQTENTHVHPSGLRERGSLPEGTTTADG